LKAVSDLPLFPRQVHDRLKLRLPGADLQATMSPRGRPSASDLNNFECREASVLALLHPHHGELSVVLIERPGHLSKHPGQIAFPGGRRESGESRLDAALRETMEEIGQDPARIAVLGALTALYIPPSGFCVYPYVGWTESLDELILDPSEVASAFSAPLRLFVDGPMDLMDMPRLKRSVPRYQVAGHSVWGATAMMLAELGAVLEPVLPLPVDCG